MIIIDGAQGEGGGQIFRTSLTLSMCSGKPVHIINIRAGRNKPGLLRQHLACLKAARTICDADVSGESLGSQEVVFSPGRIRSGSYNFSVGTAGSTTLIFQTIYPALALANDISDVTLEGGTHNGMAPSYDFIERCFLPAIRKVGYRIEANIDKFGFYPNGGGIWTAKIYPMSESTKFTLINRGEILRKSAVATQAKIPSHVAERELAELSRKLTLVDEQLKSRFVDSRGPGNILTVQLDMHDHCELIETVGERGVRAERVAKNLAKDVRTYLKSDAPVGEHLADQLIVPLALNKGGEFCTGAISKHLETNIEVVNALIGNRIFVERSNNNKWCISIA